MLGRYFGYEREIIKEKNNYVMCSKSYMGGKQFKMITRYWIEKDGITIFSHTYYSKVEEEFIKLTREVAE